MKMDKRECASRVAGFVAEAGGAEHRGKLVWLMVDGEHRIQPDCAPVPFGAEVIARFSRRSSGLDSRMLVAALWPGQCGVVKSWKSWISERVANAGGHVDGRTLWGVVESIKSCARAGDVEGASASHPPLSPLMLLS